MGGKLLDGVETFYKDVNARGQVEEVHEGFRIMRHINFTFQSGYEWNCKNSVKVKARVSNVGVEINIYVLLADETVLLAQNVSYSQNLVRV